MTGTPKLRGDAAVTGATDEVGELCLLCDGRGCALAVHESGRSGVDLSTAPARKAASL